MMRKLSTVAAVLALFSAAHAANLRGANDNQDDKAFTVTPVAAMPLHNTRVTPASLAKGAHEHEHRQLPPLSHGWAYEGNGGAGNGRKEEVDTSAAPVEGDKAPPLSHGWAYGGPAGSRKEEAGTAAAGKPEEGAHRQLQGWWWRGIWGSGPHDIARDQEAQQGDNKQALPLVPGAEAAGAEAEVDMPRKKEMKTPEHRMLPPLSHGWAYEPSSGNGRKEEVDAAAAEQPEQNKEAAAVAAEGNGKL